jgi:uncharacterized protein YbjT (DUF2867 family)
MARILIAGATGYLGLRVARQASARGHWVRVIFRRRDQVGKLGFAPDDVVVAEVTEPDSLRGLAKDIDWVFSSVGITRQKDGLTYEQVDYGGNRNLLDEALNSGARRFMYISVFRGRELRATKLVAAKERFVDDLTAAKIERCIVRPTGFFSDMVDLLKMGRSGRIWLLGDGENRLNPIDGDDLAEVCLDAMESERKELEIGGPHVYTLNEIGWLALEAWGKPEKIVHLPDVIRRGMLKALPVLTPQRLYGPIQFFLSASALEMAAPPYGTRSLKDFFRERAGEMRGK